MVVQATPFPIVGRIEADVLDLLQEAQEYLSRGLEWDLVGYRDEERLRVWAEAFRLTSRLAWIVSWAAEHRAADAGEGLCDTVSEDPEWMRVIAVECASDGAVVPPVLRLLLERSRLLLERVRRLEAVAIPPIPHDRVLRAV